MNSTMQSNPKDHDALVDTVRRNISFETFLSHLMPAALVASSVQRVSLDGMRGTTRFAPQAAQRAKLNEHLDHRPSYCGLGKNSL